MDAAHQLLHGHRLGAELRLGALVTLAEDAMEGANLFDEPIDPSTQVTANNQNDPTDLIADDEGFYDAEENVDLKYVKNMGHQIEKRQNNNNVLTYTITPRPEFEYTTSCNNQVTNWPNLFECNIQVPMFLGINESTNLIHGLICDTTSNPQRIVYTLYPEQDSSKLLETSYYWIAAEHFNGQDCNPVGFSHTNLSHNATTILSLCKPIKDYCHPPLPIPSPTETPNSTAIDNQSTQIDNQISTIVNYLTAISTTVKNTDPLIATDIPIATDIYINSNDNTVKIGIAFVGGFLLGLLVMGSGCVSILGIIKWNQKYNNQNDRAEENIIFAQENSHSQDNGQNNLTRTQQVETTV